MIIIGGSSNVTLAENIAKILTSTFINANIQKFEDQELYVQVNANLYEKEVVIVQSTSKPANDHLIELLLLASTAKRAGAKHITAVIPYLGYSRQDHANNFYEPISANLIAELIEVSGVNQVITLDLHSKLIESFFKIAVRNLDTFSLFVDLINKTKDQIIVSPDTGGITRAKLYSKKLKHELAVINKIRNAPGECSSIDVIGDVSNKHCIIIDDIVDTANTICKAAELLYLKGALSVQAFVTHAVFSKDAIKLIENSKIDKLYVTDSIIHNNLPKKIKVISINNLIAKTLKI